MTAELTQLAPTKTRSTNPTTASLVVSTPTPGVAPAPTSPSVPTPTAVVIPTPTRPGICGRTPEVQQAIIETLRIASCRLITEHELYRIRDLPEIRAPELRSGDFTGLVSLNSLSVQLRLLERTNPAVIPAGTFKGSSIGTLVLDVDAIEPGAFEDATVQALRITANQALPKNALPTSVVYLELRIVTPPNALRGDELDGLSSLESLTLALHAYETDEEFS